MKWSRGSSKKLLRVKVTSHESELEFDISPKSTGKYLFDLVCSTIGLRETWYFGLQNYTLLSNGKMKLLQWLKLDKKIVSQKSTSGQAQFCFFFHTKFFPEDIEQELIQATTRHLFYLSVKAKILSRTESSVNGSLCSDVCPTVDVAILLASLAAQADFGDVCEDDLEGKDDPLFLPNRLLRLLPKQLISRFQCDQNLAQKLKDCYKSYKGINRDKAELQYLKLAQAHHLFGVDYFPIICVRMKCPRTLSLTRYFTRNDISPWRCWNKRFTNAWLGVTAAGIQLYGRNQREKPRYTFQWNIIKNVSYRERKFTIKLVGSWRCHNKSSTPASSSIVTPFDSAEKTGDQQHRSRRTSRSTSGRSPLLGSILGPGLTAVGPCGNAPSAASLPSTPLSVRLALPVTNSFTDVNLPGTPTTSLSAHRDISGQHMGCRRKHSPNRLKVSGHTFDIDSGCVSSLFPVSSRCSTSDVPVIASGTCLTTMTKFQTTDSSAAGSSASSKGSFVIPHCSFMDQLISVVEVWLADPTQAKTVMSMCAGNHALFMRRRQPDSVEVQQMRAQAREEKARREVERSRLARARAEMAEAVEARLALESRCAQLEQALLCQQALLSGNPSDTHGAGLFLGENRKTSPVDHKKSAAQPLSIRFSSCMSPKYAVNAGTNRLFFSEMNEKDGVKNGDVYLDNRCQSPPLENEHIVPSTVSSPGFKGRVSYPLVKVPVHSNNAFDRAERNDYNPRDHTSSVFWNHHPALMTSYFGSASTPTTPYAKRSVNSRPSRFIEPPVISAVDSVFDVSYSVPCFACANPALYCPKAGCTPSYNPGAHGPDPTVPCLSPNAFRRDNNLLSQPKPDPILSRPHAPNSMPILYNHFFPDEQNDSFEPPGVAPWSCWDRSFPVVAPHKSQVPLLCPTFDPQVYPWVRGRIHPHLYRRMNTYAPTATSPHNKPSDPQVTFLEPKRCPQLSTSLSAILSPVAGHRLRHLQSRLPMCAADSFEEAAHPKDTFAHDCHGSAPFLIQSEDPRRTTYDEPMPSCEAVDASEWPKMSPDSNRGASLQHLPDSAFWMDVPISNPYVPVFSPQHDHRVRRVASVCGTGAPSVVCPLSQWPQSNDVPSTESFLHNCIPVNSPERGYLSQCLQEERAKFALLQQQFSKQLFDTWACLRVTRSAGGIKQPGLHNPVANDLRVDPAGASDGASTGGGVGGMGATSSAYAALDHLCPAENGEVCGDCFGHVDTTELDENSSALLSRGLLCADRFPSVSRSAPNPTADHWCPSVPEMSVPFRSDPVYEEAPWSSNYNEHS